MHLLESGEMYLESILQLSQKQVPLTSANIWATQNPVSVEPWVCSAMAVIFKWTRTVLLR